jgi:hypothetical protein
MTTFSGIMSARKWEVKHATASGGGGAAAVKSVVAIPSVHLALRGKNKFVGALFSLYNRYFL